MANLPVYILGQCHPTKELVERACGGSGAYAWETDWAALFANRPVVPVLANADTVGHVLEMWRGPDDWYWCVCAATDFAKVATLLPEWRTTGIGLGMHLSWSEVRSMNGRREWACDHKIHHLGVLSWGETMIWPDRRPCQVFWSLRTLVDNLPAQVAAQLLVGTLEIKER